MCENFSKMHMWTLFSFLFIITVETYKPVVIIHGIMTGNITMLPLAADIKAAHPGTKVYVTGRFSGWSSLLPLWHQIMEIGADIANITLNHPEGIHLLGYSQGGLIARGVIEAFPDLNIRKFISLSSPQGGQYGATFLHLFFPNLTCKTAYELFYSRMGQKISVGNYWRDPHHENLYSKYSNFLPFINNDVESLDSSSFKEGITNLEKLVMIGGPDDGVIIPWQSSRFGYFDEDENVVELQDQSSYQSDSLGLKTLNETGRLKIIELSGVQHFDWHWNKTVIDKYLLPEFD